MTYSQLNSLSIEELRALNSKVVEVIKMKRSEMAFEVKDELRVGMKINIEWIEEYNDLVEIVGKHYR